jgi:hypothetical protein
MKMERICNGELSEDSLHAHHSCTCARYDSCVLGIVISPRRPYRKRSKILPTENVDDASHAIATIRADGLSSGCVMQRRIV